MPSLSVAFSTFLPPLPWSFVYLDPCSPGSLQGPPLDLRAPAPPGGLAETREWGPISGVSDPPGLGWGLRTGISNKFQVTCCCHPSTPLRESLSSLAEPLADLLPAASGPLRLGSCCSCSQGCPSSLSGHLLAVFKAPFSSPCSPSPRPPPPTHPSTLCFQPSVTYHTGVSSLPFRLPLPLDFQLSKYRD